MKLLLITLFFTLLSVEITAAELELTDAQGNDIQVEISPAEGDLLVIWLLDHAEERPQFETMLRSVNAAGIEIWRVDLLRDYFLPRSSENIRTLSGDGVSALLQAAHRLSRKRILLAAYDRMPLPLLRGVKQWQATQPNSRLAGAVLFYPNLFGPAPLAGDPPMPDPILKATSIPLVIYQPELGSHRWRLRQVISTLWQHGSPSFVYLVPQARDWFFMGETDHGPGAENATRAIPKQLLNFARLLDTYPKPAQTASFKQEKSEIKEAQDLVKFEQSRQAPSLILQDMQGQQHQLDAYLGQVVLISFWATWCPPCVEEIPSLNRLAGHFANRPFKIISVDFRENRETLRQFVREIPVDFPILLDADGLASLEWNVFSFPSSFLIDPQGMINYSANRALDWNTPQVRQAVDSLFQPD